jgi:hypothetical protein
MTGKGNGKYVEGSGRGLRCNPGIFLEGLRKTTKSSFRIADAQTEI